MKLRLLLVLAAVALAGCAAATDPRGTNDLGMVIERADGAVSIVETSGQTRLARVEGLGDLSHAHIAYSRDGRYGYVFGRDGGLSKVDLLRRRVDRRIIQSGNAIGGAISQDGRLIVVQNYTPGGIKVFDAQTLRQISEVPAEYAPGKRSKVVGLADLPGQKFAYALFDAGEIWITDLSDPARPATQRYEAGRQPYDALVTPDGRYYIAGLFGEDALAMMDLWHPEAGVRKILQGYGRGEEALPVYKMPHLRGWSAAGGRLFLPAIGRHEVLVVDTATWQETGRIATLGQPVFVMAQPDGRRVWVNFAVPDNGQVQVIDTDTLAVVRTLAPGRGVLHMEFTPRGEAVWLSARDDDRVVVYDTRTLQRGATLDIPKPSGIFFTNRSGRIGF
ncbi:MULTISPECIES: cytochrome D1 domain-containing protein [Achromobacter]|uniref:cytochrome D1 domain-containing protein n=1 Tax=Achromobacter TaxID=222 RepID=UPI00244C1114|nr:MULTISPECIES: cytochrome D1 domain-containing protein [Achromobacter]MDH1300105.1 protein nirF [Achromobacter sp. GD03932]WLW60756.1 cytochrome D1 domain-containing protein [Achromobacter aegrifaciens]